MCIKDGMLYYMPCCEMDMYGFNLASGKMTDVITRSMRLTVRGKSWTSAVFRMILLKADPQWMFSMESYTS